MKRSENLSSPPPLLLTVKVTRDLEEASLRSYKLSGKHHPYQIVLSENATCLAHHGEMAAPKRISGEP
jgi:hypothetical protein